MLAKQTIERKEEEANIQPQPRQRQRGKQTQNYPRLHVPQLIIINISTQVFLEESSFCLGVRDNFSVALCKREDVRILLLV